MAMPGVVWGLSVASDVDSSNLSSHLGSDSDSSSSAYIYSSDGNSDISEAAKEHFAEIMMVRNNLRSAVPKPVLNPRPKNRVERERNQKMIKAYRKKIHGIVDLSNANSFDEQYDTTILIFNLIF